MCDSISNSFVLRNIFYHFRALFPFYFIFLSWNTLQQRAYCKVHAHNNNNNRLWRKQTICRTIVVQMCICCAGAIMCLILCCKLLSAFRIRSFHFCGKYKYDPINIASLAHWKIPKTMEEKCLQMLLSGVEKMTSTTKFKRANLKDSPRNGCFASMSYVLCIPPSGTIQTPMTNK